MNVLGHWTRRRVLSTTAGVAAVAVAGGSRSALAAPYVLKKGTKLTYWGGLIFSDDANKLLVETINAWGAANGVETEVVMINQNETVQKVSAAVESNTMPDALDLGLDLLLLLSRQGVFIDRRRSLRQDRRGPGRLVRRSSTAATDTTGSPAAAPASPSASAATCCCAARTCSSQPASPRPPTTWEELVDQAAAVNKPPVFGLGLALSNVGDGNVQVSVLQSYGGRIADDAGKKVTIKSEETRDLPHLAEGRLGQGPLPARRDHLGRRRRQPGLSLRPGGLHRQHRLGRHRRQEGRSGALRGDRLLAAAGRPEGHRLADQPATCARSRRHSQNQDAAKALIEHLSQPGVHERATSTSRSTARC